MGFCTSGAFRRTWEEGGGLAHDVSRAVHERAPGFPGLVEPVVCESVHVDRFRAGEGEQRSESGGGRGSGRSGAQAVLVRNTSRRPSTVPGAMMGSRWRHHKMSSGSATLECEAFVKTLSPSLPVRERMSTWTAGVPGQSAGWSVSYDPSRTTSIIEVRDGRKAALAMWDLTKSANETETVGWGAPGSSKGEAALFLSARKCLDFTF